MRKLLIFAVLFISFSSCKKDDNDNSVKVTIDPKVDFLLNDSLITFDYQIIEKNTISYLLDKEKMPNEILLGYNFGYSKNSDHLQILIREKFKIADLQNDNSDILDSKATISGGLRIYNLSDSEISKILKVGSKTSVPNGDYILCNDGVIITYQNSNGMYLNTDFDKNVDLFEIQEFKKYDKSELQNIKLGVDSDYLPSENYDKCEVYGVKIKFSVRLVNIKLDTIRLKDCTAFSIALLENN